jgi:hypothetical protein
MRGPPLATSIGKPEIHQLDSGLGQHDVAWLQIAMHNTTAMSFFQPMADFSCIFQYLLDRERSLIQTVGEGFAFQVFHNQKIDAVLMTDIVERADVRMVQGRNRTCFAFKPLLCVRIGRKMCRKDLNRDRALQPRITSAIHFAHAAGAERRDDLIWPEFVAISEPHNWPRLCAPSLASPSHSRATRASRAHRARGGR